MTDNALAVFENYKIRRHYDEQAGRLLIVTPFVNGVKRVSAETAEKRNRFMFELADEVVIGYAGKGGMLERLVAEVKGKKVIRIQE